MKPVIELIGDRMSEVEYTGHPVESFQPTTDKAIKKAFDFLREKIDANMYAVAFRWTFLRKDYVRLLLFSQSHCNTSCDCV